LTLDFVQLILRPFDSHSHAACLPLTRPDTDTSCAQPGLLVTADVAALRTTDDVNT
jgi:hypothetical protein